MNDWKRPWFTRAAGTPFLFYVAYGRVELPLRVSGARYRVRGIPEGLDIMQYGPDQNPEVVDNFREGYLWNLAREEQPDLARAVSEQAHCVVVRGELKDRATLNEFRDVVGLLTYFLDSGCVALFDPLSFHWWSPQEWRERAFEPGEPVPRAHVTVLWSDEPDGRWIHTRGMRKFGRSDVSIRGVPPDSHDAAVDLCNRLIELQALGGVIDDGEEIRMASLPPGMHCFQRGAMDDPDFNNIHVEITWATP